MYFNFKQKKFLSAILSVSGAMLLGHLITFIVQPILTRLYSPLVFADYAIFLTSLSFLTPIILMSLPYALFAFAGLRKRIEIIKLSLQNIFIFALCSLIFLFIFNQVTDLDFGFFLISIISGVFSSLVLLNQLNYIAQGFFGKRAILHVFLTLVVALVKISGFYIFDGTDALIKSHLLAYMIYFIALPFFDKNVFGFLKFRNVSLRPKFYNHYYKFGFYKTISATTNAIAVLLPIYVLSIYYDKLDLGYFSLAYTLMSAPIILIGTSLYEISLRFLNGIKVLTLNLRLKMLACYFSFVFLGILFFPVLHYNGSVIFEFIFGNGWAESGNYSAIIALWATSHIGIKPLIAFITISNYERSNLIIELAFIVLRFPLIYYCIENEKSPVFFVLIYYTTLVFSEAFKIVYFLFIGKRSCGGPA